MSCIGLCGKGRIMIKVAFCDDDLSVLKELSVLMDRYRVERYYISGCSDAGTGWNQCRQRDP